MPLTAGDRVTVPLMPDLGVGLVEWVAAGRHSVSFWVAGRSFVDEFVEAELERAKPKIARTA